MFRLNLWIKRGNHCVRSLPQSQEMKVALGQDPLISVVKSDQITAKCSYADLAQLVEHIIRNDGVVGSNPIVGTTFLIFE